MRRNSTEWNSPAPELGSCTLIMGQALILLWAFVLAFPALLYADGIDDFNNGWSGQALSRQRLMDIEARLVDMP